MTSMGLKSCGGSSAVLAASFLRLFIAVFVGLQRETSVIGLTSKPYLGCPQALTGDKHETHPQRFIFVTDECGLLG